MVNEKIVECLGYKIVEDNSIKEELRLPKKIIELLSQEDFSTKCNIETSYNVEVTKVEKPNSFECGKSPKAGESGKKHKIYYDEIEELKQRLLDLDTLRLIDLEECNIDVNKLVTELEEEKPEIS